MKGDPIIDALDGVTKKWAKQRKREEREASARANRFYVMTRVRSVSQKEAAGRVMEAAYLHASTNDTLPAHARQIMYAARPEIQRQSDRPLGKNFSKYFTQTLLPDYINETGVDWNVVYDARGHLWEPHTDEEVPLGTLQVEDYLKRIRIHGVSEQDFSVLERWYPTLGPKHRYGAILFIEKEGFMPLFEAVKLAERYDLAIMSTKGMSVTAARSLVDTLCAKYDIPLLVLRDFDKNGFSIAATLTGNTRRYTYENQITAIDFGLRMEDIDGLVAEEVYYDASKKAIRANLRGNGATEEEIEFLLHQRVELNAFASGQFIEWIEGKLVAHGIKKVVPDDNDLASAYRRLHGQMTIQKHINTLLEDMADDEVPVPGGLSEQVASRLKRDPALSWDAAVKQILTSEIIGDAMGMFLDEDSDE